MCSIKRFFQDSNHQSRHHLLSSSFRINGMLYRTPKEFLSKRRKGSDFLVVLMKGPFVFKFLVSNSC